jgi:uncharacterized protein (UPF0332 family)
MNPTDFLETADLLKKKNHQGHLRTSIGRSYYATFLYFRERLKSKGLVKTIRPNNEAHSFVIDCLQFSQINEGTKAGRYLKDLQQVREDADYNLDIVLDPNDAKDALDRALNAIKDYNDNISKSPDKEDQLIVKAKEHAKLKGWIK